MSTEAAGGAGVGGAGTARAGVDLLAGLPGADPCAAHIALKGEGLLHQFNQAGVLTSADVHVALRIGRLGSTDDAAVLLAAALAVRAPRLGHVSVDLAGVRDTVSSDLDVPVDVRALPWPEPPGWVRQVAASALVGADRPLRLEGAALYLDRYWSEECRVAADIVERAEVRADGVDVELLADGLRRLFRGDEAPDLQRLAAASAVLRRFSVIAGGPGTGKTTTVARVLALLDEQGARSGRRPLLVALAAPTGKAAARLEEAVHDEAARLALEPGTRARLLRLRGTTLHRLLGRSPASRTRFRHDRLTRLAHDVIVVDETSMVSLSLMARLVEAVRPDARLILVGDPEQLASVEAGAVLGDLVGPAALGLRMRPAAREALAAVSGQAVPATDPPGRRDREDRAGGPPGVGRPGPVPPATSVGDGIVVLRRVHRFGAGIARLARAIQSGDAGGAMDVLSEGDPDLLWLPVDVSGQDADDSLGPVRSAVVSAGRRVSDAARAGRAPEALAALGTFRVLCAHRRGPAGVSTWMARIERWLAETVEEFAADGTWYVGRPVLVTANDYSLRLYNGDTGVVVRTASGRVAAAFERGAGVVEVSPTRLASVDTVYAMTVHKAQGSQFDTVAVLLPGPDSPILTRELLYTAVTRARRRLIVAGTEPAIRTGVGRPIARSSGLRRRLWGA
jgi:exodeoxyribonuclease V alpha subunit